MATVRGRKRALLSGRAPVTRTGGPSRSATPMTSGSTSQNPSIETSGSPSEAPPSAPSSSRAPSSRVGASLLSVPIRSDSDHVSPGDVHVSLAHVCTCSFCINVFVDSITFLLPRASRDITSIIKGSYTGAWKTWREVPIDQRNLWFEKFKGLYHWAPEKDEIIRQAFNYVASDRLKEILTRARDSASKKSNGSKDPNVYVKSGPPLWMPAIVWNVLCSPSHWGSERWQNLSLQNKQNRRTLKDGMMVTHTGGSINFEIHSENMMREKEQEPTPLEFYLCTHTSKKTKGFVCKKAKRVWDDYHRLEAEKYGDDPSSQPGFDTMLWINTASSDGPSCNRTFGFGSAYTANETILRSSRNNMNTDRFQAQLQRSETYKELVRYKEKVENLTQ
ncbi:hypothetical protein CDL12_19725 [Handroanthus impetiginosus]|uniref:Transposase, Ptta/En/Spm, plant n=1 Tax=Handroanthus impetiginosus TaxID=429701 RepID=A0A2G9GQY8_9LAMI|nr:hypothetical protein CDL12_19725 [Handroanthus impetiginosus]